MDATVNISTLIFTFYIIKKKDRRRPREEKKRENETSKKFRPRTCLCNVETQLPFPNTNSRNPEPPYACSEELNCEQTPSRLVSWRDEKQARHFSRTVNTSRTAILGAWRSNTRQKKRRTKKLLLCTQVSPPRFSFGEFDRGRRPRFRFSSPHSNCQSCSGVGRTGAQWLPVCSPSTSGRSRATDLTSLTYSPPVWSEEGATLTRTVLTRPSRPG